MDFKDSLGKVAKNLGEGAATAAKKGGEIFEITKLNMSLQSCSTRIEELKETLGDLIYKRYTEGLELEKDALKICKEIDDLKAQMKVLNKKISSLRDIKYCSSCGIENSKNNKFCSNCGASL